MIIVKQPLVSVIIPVYNVEQYLERCVRSVQNQTYTNLEIILVDDGSPDNCPAMCDALAADDNRIVVIHQQNMGVGIARNAGLDIFKSNWVCFIDSDDWIEPAYVETLLSAAVDNNCLMATCKLRCAFSESKIVDTTQIPEVKLFNKREYLLYMYKKRVSYHNEIPGYSPWPTWISIYNREIVKNNRFSHHRVGGEEIASLHLFIHSCEKNNSSIAVSNLCLYNYFQNVESATKSKKSKYWLDMPEAIDIGLKFYKQNNEQELYDIYWQFYFSFYIDIACECSRDIPQYKQEIENVIERIKMEKSKAFSLSHPKLNLSLSAKFNWNKLVKSETKFVLYGYGKNGKRLLKWLRYFNIPIIEVWDVSAVSGQTIDGIPINTMHKKLANQNIQILCSIQDSAVYYPVFYELRMLGYEKIMPYEALNGAITYATYKKILPFLLENIDE